MGFQQVIARGSQTAIPNDDVCGACKEKEARIASLQAALTMADAMAAEIERVSDAFLQAKNSTSKIWAAWTVLQAARENYVREAKTTLSAPD